MRREAPSLKLGSLLAEIGRETGGFETEGLRDQTPTEPLRFE